MTIRDSNSEIREIVQAGYRYALSLSQDRHDAEDLVQQACLRVLRSRGELVGRAYVFTAVRNLFIDQSRQKAAAKNMSIVEFDALPGTESHERQIDDRSEIEVLLARLRPNEREALYLNCVEGFSASEIGRLVGAPRGTVLSLLSRAKSKLAAEGPKRVESKTT